MKRKISKKEESFSDVESLTPPSSAPNSESESEDNELPKDELWIVKIYNLIIDWSVQRSLENQSEFSKRTSVSAVVVLVVLNALLVISKERYESNAVDVSSSNKLLFETPLMLNRFTSTDALLDEEWAASQSHYLLESLLTSPSFFLALCLFISCANAVVFFRQSRVYRLMQASPVIPLNQGKYDISSVELKSTFTSTTDITDDATFFGIVWQVVLFPVRVGLCRPVAFIWRKLCDSRTASVPKRDERVYFWQLRLWSPSQFSQLLFIWFAPLHVLFVCLSPANWIFMTTLHGLLFSVTISLLSFKYRQRLVDQTLLFDQAMMEYNENFVYPNQKWSYSASAYNPKIATKPSTPVVEVRPLNLRKRVVTRLSPTVRASSRLKKH